MFDICSFATEGYGFSLRTQPDNLIQKVAGGGHTLSPAKRRVAHRGLEDPGAIVYCTLAELALRAEVSEPRRRSNGDLHHEGRHSVGDVQRHLLAVNAPEDPDLYTPMTSRIAHLAVIDVLALGVALAGEEATAERLRRIKAGLRNKRLPRKDRE